jgi:NnrU protein
MKRVRDATEYRKGACRGDETVKALHNGEYAVDTLKLKRNGERSMLSLVLGAICFAGIHLGIAGTALRDSAIATLGEGAYRAVFSIVP